ncbi:MAG: hypothetical protein WCG08_06105 [Paludibacter sp.]
MKISSYISVFLFLSLVLACCTNPPNELQKAESLVETKPDSALQILRHLSSNKYKSTENKALYLLLMTEALDRRKLPMLPDSLLDFSMHYYQKYPDPVRLANCYLYEGRKYKYSFQLDKASSSFVQGLELIENSEEYLLSARLNFDLADISLYQKEFDKARQKYSEAYYLYLKAKSIYFANTTLLSIGISYCYEKKYKDAQQYFYRFYLNSNDSLSKGLAIQNLGINYYALKQYDSALFYLRKSLSYPYIQTNMAVRVYYLADLYFDLHQYDSAGYYAKKSFSYKSDIVTRRECYRILVNTSNAKKDVSGLKEAMVAYQNCIDSIRKIDAQPKGSYIETMHHSKREAVKTRKWLGYLSLGIILILILSVLLYLQLHKRKSRELNQSTEKHKELMLKHREALIQKIKNTKDSQTAIRKKLSFAEKELLDKKIYNDILHLQDTSYFLKLMDANMNNLPGKLKERYEEVSDREIKWCCLTLLEIPVTDILNVLDYKLEALNKMKTRLAAKLQLQSATELSIFLQGILSENY